MLEIVYETAYTRTYIFIWFKKRRGSFDDLHDKVILQRYVRIKKKYSTRSLFGDVRVILMLE